METKKYIVGEAILNQAYCTIRDGKIYNARADEKPVFTAKQSYRQGDEIFIDGLNIVSDGIPLFSVRHSILSPLGFSMFVETFFPEAEPETVKKMTEVFFEYFHEDFDKLLKKI